MAYRTQPVDAAAVAIGAAIRQAREAAGMTLQEAADLCGYEHRSAWHRIETGKVHPKAAHLLKIAAALGMDLNRLRDHTSGGSTRAGQPGGES